MGFLVKKLTCVNMIFLLGNFSRKEISGATLTGSNYLHYILLLYYYFIFIYYFNDFFCHRCAQQLYYVLSV